MFKEGDRVLKGNERCVIIKVLKRDKGWYKHDKEWYRCYIRYLDNYNVQGTNVETWVGHDELELDTQYIREQKLNELGI